MVLVLLLTDSVLFRRASAAWPHVWLDWSVEMQQLWGAQDQEGRIDCSQAAVQHGSAFAPSLPLDSTQEPPHACKRVLTSPGGHCSPLRLRVVSCLSSLRQQSDKPTALWAPSRSLAAAPASTNGPHSSSGRRADARHGGCAPSEESREGAVTWTSPASGGTHIHGSRCLPPSSEPAVALKSLSRAWR